jgi:hypothetical protein
VRTIKPSQDSDRGSDGSYVHKIRKHRLTYSAIYSENIVPIEKAAIKEFDFELTMYFSSDRPSFALPILSFLFCPS